MTRVHPVAVVVVATTAAAAAVLRLLKPNLFKKAVENLGQATCRRDTVVHHPPSIRWVMRNIIRGKWEEKEKRVKGKYQ